MCVFLQPPIDVVLFIVFLFDLRSDGILLL